MIKHIERNEVLRRVRFSKRYYNPSTDKVYSSNKPCNFQDLEIIRYNRKDWIETHKIMESLYFITIEDFRNEEESCLLLVIDNQDLQHLANCGYGFLKGCDNDG